MEDEELFQGLLTHLSPTITRLQHDLPIYNPLLSQIQKEYGELYEQTKQACRVLENYCGAPISADETGFITMHIGASLERMQHTAIHRRVIPIGVVCASGIGVSAMLSARIQKSFHPDVKLQIFSMEDVQRHAYDDAELLVSTFSLDVSDREVIVVTPLLNQQDIHNIRAAVTSRQELSEPLQKMCIRDRMKEGGNPGKEKTMNPEFTPSKTVRDIIQFDKEHRQLRFLMDEEQVIPDVYKRQVVRIF